MEGWGFASVASGVCHRVELSCAESGRHALGTGATPTLGLAVQIGALILGSGTLLDLALRRLRLSLVVTA